MLCRSFVFKFHNSQKSLKFCSRQWSQVIILYSFKKIANLNCTACKKNWMNPTASFYFKWKFQHLLRCNFNNNNNNNTVRRWLMHGDNSSRIKNVDSCIVKTCDKSLVKRPTVIERSLLWTINWNRNIWQLIWTSISLLKKSHFFEKLLKSFHSSEFRWIENCGWLLINFTLAAKYPCFFNSAPIATCLVNDAFRL